MARHIRGRTDKGYTYHVSSDVNRKAHELEVEEMKALFIEVIEEAKTKKCFQFELHTFCIMDNHFHFLITPVVGESLSRIIQWIKQVYAVRWNKRHKTTGHFWGDRFWCRRVKDDNDFWTVFEYIEQNPVKAGLVTMPEEWKYCGAYHRCHGITKIISVITMEFWDRFIGVHSLGVCP